MKRSGHILIVGETTLENYFLQQALACRGLKGCLQAAANIDQLCSSILGLTNNANRRAASPLPSLILLDLTMPDALDILRAIRESRCSQVPVIGLARRNDQLLVQKAFDRGMNSVVFRSQGYDAISQEIEEIRSPIATHKLPRTREFFTLDPISRN